MSSSGVRETFLSRAKSQLPNLSLSALTVLGLFALTSCGQSMPAGYPGGPKSTVTPGTMNPLTLPPVYGDVPGDQGASGGPGTNGLPTLQARGLNTKLFSDKLSNRDDRLSRLESAVQAIRDEFDVMTPSITRLVAIEKDIQNLIAQLEILTGTGPMPDSDIPPIEQSALDSPITERRAANAEAIMQMAPPVPGESAAQMAMAETIEEEGAAPSIEPAAGAVLPKIENAVPEDRAIQNAHIPAIAATDLKAGEHPDKTRIVIYLNGDGNFTTDLDNNEKLLLVEIPGVRWDAPVENVYPNSPLLSFYSVTSHTPDKTILTFQLKKAAKIAYSGKLAQEAGKGQRLIIDLASQN